MNAVDDAVFFQFVSSNFPGLRSGQVWTKLLVVPGLQRDDVWKEGVEGPTTRITAGTYEQIRFRFEEAIEVGETAQFVGFATTQEEALRLARWLATLRDRQWLPSRTQLIRIHI